MKRASVKWIEKMKFVGVTPSCHHVAMDAVPEVGGDNSAPRPADLLLVALGGCTGMDVVSILRKMRVEFKSLEILVDGEPRKEHPKYFEKIHVKYILMGKALDESKVKTAIELSEEKYCSVSALLKKGTELTFDYEIIEDVKRSPIW